MVWRNDTTSLSPLLISFSSNFASVTAAPSHYTLSPFSLQLSIWSNGFLRDLETFQQYPTLRLSTRVPCVSRNEQSRILRNVKSDAVLMVAVWGLLHAVDNRVQFSVQRSKFR